jgi:hypothetical protein
MLLETNVVVRNVVAENLLQPVLHFGGGGSKPRLRRRLA